MKVIEVLNLTRKEELVSAITKEELYDLWVIKNYTYPEMMKQFNLNKRWELNYILRYYNFPRKDLHLIGQSSSKTQKDSWENKPQYEKDEWSKKCSEVELSMSEDKKRLKKEKYVKYWNSLSDKEKSNINKKKSETLKKVWSENKDEMLKKQRETMKSNKLIQESRLCRSTSEQRVFDSLIDIYPDVLYDERVDDRYPYFVDFYVPSEDLFIELNAHPSHGRLPFKMLQFDEYSKYPTKWADVFGRRDVEKQEKARESNINYIMIYPSATLQENININNKQYSKLVETLYNSQI